MYLDRSDGPSLGAESVVASYDEIHSYSLPPEDQSCSICFVQLQEEETFLCDKCLIELNTHEV